MKKLVLFAISLAASLALSAQTLPYQDTSLSPEERAVDLVGRLTLEEKTMLVQHVSNPVERLGIKKYHWWNEALHGVARNGVATVFPQPIGMASSFDTEMIETVFTAVSDEARVKNRMAKESQDEILQYQGVTFWTPNINIFRDPRWGRGMETYGEDPYLTGQLGMAVVRGLQGPEDSKILKAHACAKHFAVHSGLESNRHRFDANVSERDLRETYLPAFKDLVTKAHVKEVMTAYNSFRGVPCAASSYLVQDILRGEWGYDGMVVSDCWAIPDFFQKGHHEWVDTDVLAAAAAVSNGLDVECGSTFSCIPEAVKAGLLDEADLDRNLVRVLAQRFRLGEMDDISLWDDLDDSIVEGEANRKLSLQMAHESLVLLQNRNSVLPLRTDQKIAVIGPNMDDAEMQWGNYNPIPNHTTTLLQALQTRIPGIVNFRACGIADPQPAGNTRFPGIGDVSQIADDDLESLAKRYAVDVRVMRQYINRERRMRENFLPVLDEAAVLKDLEGIDVVIFAGGISPRLEGEEMPVTIKGFSGGDRTDIELPDVQRRLLKALHEAGKKVILVSFSGGAMGLVPETETCDAILQAWYPGEEGGTAIADVLFGDVNPSGKLPVTFYKSVDQLPEVENYDMEGHTYRYFRDEPLYPFGYGLSYSNFKYGKVKVRKGVVTVKVKNTSKVAGAEVVQLYVTRPDDVNGPVKTLRGYKRVTIPAKKAVKVRIALDDETFTWWDEASQRMVPLAGNYELYVGSSSDIAALKMVNYKFVK